jgi:Ca-activated chloride channel family protein
MYIPGRFRKTISILFAYVLLVSMLTQIAAQEPPQPPRSKPATNQKSDKSKKADGRAGAQSDEQSQELGDEAIKIDTELVQLDVTVIDQNNNPVFSLNKDDFTVYEDKVKQTINSLSREEVPLSFGIVIDTSGSMRSRFQTVSDATQYLIKQMRADDEAFLAEFKVEAELVQEFTDDKRELEDAIGELFTSGGTALLDAIIASSDYAQEKGKRRRKAIIVMSDGLERNSSVKEKEVINAIKENEVQLYMIGFLDEEESKSLFGKSPTEKAQELLIRLAEDSGGRAFFPKDLSEIPAIAAQIAKDLRTQYILSYYPSNSLRDGTFRTVRVEVNSNWN